MRKLTTGIVVLILLIIMWSPTVEAAETRIVDGWIRIDPDINNMTVNFSWNMSDPSNSYLFNWNQTVDPFEQNNSLNGSFTGTFLPPIDLQVTENFNTLTLSGLVKFKSTWIMSGSTESWWRIPVQGPGWGDSTNLTLWHIDSPATLNVTNTGAPTNISHPTKVFDQDFEMDIASLNKTVRYWNGTAWNRPFNSTWLRVGAQIHTDEFYLVRWVIHNNGDPYRIRFSSTDQAEDRVYKTWIIHDNGFKEIYQADVDYSVLHILGMGYAVWGHEIVVSEGEGGGGGPDIWGDPDDEDMITESLSPTGTDHDGDWSSGCALSGSTVHLGDYSVYKQLTSGNWIRYTYDTPWDVTVWDTFTIWVRTFPAISQISLRFYDTDSHAYWKAFAITPGIWTEFIVDLDDWSGWNVIGTPDLTIQNRLYIYNQAASTDYLLVDHIYFETGGGGGPEVSASITWNTKLDHNITAGEYLTVMVPFLDLVENETNVLITFGTQNDSWGTGFWVAADGPTDFGLESVQWDVGWGATDMKITMTIYNVTRSLWIMDSNPEFDPDWTWELNRYTVEDHEWAPDDYYFGGTPYHSLQVTNGSWENTHPTGTYFIEGREVHPDQIMEKRQDSNHFLVDIWLEGYEGVARVTASFTFVLTGQFDRAWDALDPTTPFPLDAPWYLGKFWYWSLDFLTGLGKSIWAGLVWLYEVGVWIVNNAGWIFAGVLTLFVLLVIIPIWSRFFKAIWGLIHFGWILAEDGVLAASEFAEEFWADFIATSIARKVAKKIPIGTARG